LPTRIVHTTNDLRYLLNIYCGLVLHQRMRDGIQPFTPYWFFCYRYILQLRTWTWNCWTWPWS